MPLCWKQRCQLPPSQARVHPRPGGPLPHIQVHSSNIECMLESLYRCGRGRGLGRCCRRGGPGWLTWPWRLRDLAIFSRVGATSPRSKGQLPRQQYPTHPRSNYHSSMIISHGSIVTDGFSKDGRQRVHGHHLCGGPHFFKKPPNPPRPSQVEASVRIIQVRIPPWRPSTLNSAWNFRNTMVSPGSWGLGKGMLESLCFRCSEASTTPRP